MAFEICKNSGVLNRLPEEELLKKYITNPAVAKSIKNKRAGISEPETEPLMNQGIMPTDVTTPDISGGAAAVQAGALNK